MMNSKMKKKKKPTPKRKHIVPPEGYILYCTSKLNKHAVITRMKPQKQLKTTAQEK